MLDRNAALEIVSRQVPSGLEIHEVRELPQGWLFTYRCADELVCGSQGVIVNKASGDLFELGSAFPVDRDVEMYDRGYQFEHYDLVILRIADVERTLDVLDELGITTVEPSYEHGTVWRVDQVVTRAELRASIANLPRVFGHLALYFRLETLEQARETQAFRFEVLRCTCPSCRSPTGRCS